MERIAIVGPGGAGKSTLARRLGTRLGLPVVHLDAEHWRPGWVEPPRDEWARKVAALAAGERWVMDGNYGGTMELRFAAADTIVFLDFPRLLCIWRVLKRQLRYRGRSRPDMTQGCPERISPEFVRWIWEYPRTRRPGVLARMRTAGAHARHVILRSPRQVEAFMRSLP
ncbi:MAG TPA: DNA topology modulation protein [Longimicrobiaceae bacterium]|nr:DNA topology modulation protein [Longimicrobiaceae bacterium]